MSLFGLILLSPVLFVVAILIKVKMPGGPVIFKQKRVGQHGKLFTMYKFRSMKMNEQEQTGWTTPEDKRKTRFGTFMRKTGIDELPQFFNVLMGDMSLVGPRPERPQFVEKFREEIRSFQPDVIHSWGVEYDHALAMVNAAEATSLSV